LITWSATSPTARHGDAQVADDMCQLITWSATSPTGEIRKYAEDLPVSVDHLVGDVADG